VVQLTDFSQPQVKVHQPDESYLFKYRGCSYRVQGSIQNTPIENPSLVGKRLQYRGVTYEVISTTDRRPAAPNQMFKLCYRGRTFWSSSKPNSSKIDYVVV
jgi:Domain of unknown function (DUF4278)